MKFLWYIITVMLIILILIQSPKKEGFRTLNFQNQTFSNTKESERLIQSITWCLVVTFIFFTAILAKNY
uniref:Probable protein-export membrane protein SecG n=1 Tax=Corynoplastis japonica TaxID=700918 RepID=A0A1X9PTV2_9RHOD|nr:preprotein translocase SecG subunit [Corynoplastis japonica]